MTVGVAAVGVGAAVGVVAVAVVQWSNLEFEVWGGTTHNTLHISIAHRLRSYNRNCNPQGSGVVPLLHTRQGARRAKCERTVSKGAGDYQHADYMQALCE